MQPATRWFDESFAPILTFDERIAHQYRFDPPPEFPLASTYASIVHHLSGPNKCTRTHSEVHRTVAYETTSLSLRVRAFNSITRTLVRLLDPCFKTGRRPHCLGRNCKQFFVCRQGGETTSNSSTRPFQPCRSLFRRELRKVPHCIRSYGIRFNLNDFRSFNSPSGVLFIFPSRYFFAIGFSLIFSRGWTIPPFSTPIPRSTTLTRRTVCNLIVSIQGYHLLWHKFHISYAHQVTGSVYEVQFKEAKATLILTSNFSNFVRHY